MAEHAPLVALVEIAAATEEALTAGGEEGTEHAVAFGDARDCVTGCDHGADVLVPEGEAGLDLDSAVVEMEVGAADAGRLDPDDRLVGCRQLGIGLLVDPDLARGLKGHCAHGPRI